MHDWCLPHVSKHCIARSLPPCFQMQREQPMAGAKLRPLLGAPALAQLRCPSMRMQQWGSNEQACKPIHCCPKLQFQSHCAHTKSGQCSLLTAARAAVARATSAPLAGVLREQAFILSAHERLQRLRREAIPVPMRQLLRARQPQRPSEDLQFQVPSNCRSAPRPDYRAWGSAAPAGPPAGGHTNAGAPKAQAVRCAV